MNIPVIDLNSDFNSGQSKESVRLREASERLGCFRVINHGVPIELMADMKSLAADLMDFPDEMKKKDTYLCKELGYMAPDLTGPSPQLESLGLFEASSSTAIDESCSLLHLSPLQRRIMEKYAEAIHKVTIDVANKLAKSMGLESDHLFEDWLCRFRLNKYNFSPETVGFVGFEIHTDSGFITLLQDDDNVGGLEMMNLSGDFAAVDPFPGSLLVNLGDTAVIWSNGRLNNVQHRVKCTEAKKRYSIATICIPPWGMDIPVPQEFVDIDHSRLYSSLSYEELRLLRGVRFVAGEAVEALRIGN